MCFHGKGNNATHNNLSCNYKLYTLKPNVNQQRIGHDKDHMNAIMASDQRLPACNALISRSSSFTFSPDIIYANSLIVPAINLFFPLRLAARSGRTAVRPYWPWHNQPPLSHLSGNLSPYVLVVKDVPDPLPLYIRAL